MSIFIRTVPNVMQHYGCSADVAQRYIDLRDEGYSMAQAALMAGLSDPPDDSSEERSAHAAHASNRNREI
jgi:hypothetical protein